MPKLLTLIIFNNQLFRKFTLLVSLWVVYEQNVYEVVVNHNLYDILHFLFSIIFIIFL